MLYLIGKKGKPPSKSYLQLTSERTYSLETVKDSDIYSVHIQEH